MCILKEYPHGSDWVTIMNVDHPIKDTVMVRNIIGDKCIVSAQQLRLVHRESLHIASIFKHDLRKDEGCDPNISAVYIILYTNETYDNNSQRTSLIYQYKDDKDIQLKEIYTLFVHYIGTDNANFKSNYPDVTSADIEIFK